MIPLHLRISGFLSYRDPVELDFASFDLACVTGHNGAGKSSLLDAMTWALFGEARSKNADVINLRQDVKAAEVALTFAYEGNIFRVIRTLPRGKSAALEFQILDGGAWTMERTAHGLLSASQSWKPLTEKSTRETQERIKQTLRMDYDTFINASFFLQGKADEFTKRKPGERKEVLSSILGLEIWDVYKERAAERRRQLEAETQEFEGRIAEIESELAEEETRKARLAELEKALAQLSSARTAQESALENIRKNAALLQEQRKLADALSAALKRSKAELENIENRLTQKQSEQAMYADLLSRAADIEANYKAWQTLRKELEAFEEPARKFHAQNELRQPLLREIEVEKAKLEQEIQSLSHQFSVISEQGVVVGVLEEQVKAAQVALKEAEEKVNERSELSHLLAEAREKGAALKVENNSLRKEMDEIKERIDSLEQTEGAVCPLCGQELSEEHRASTLADLNKLGKEKGGKFRANKAELEEIEKRAAGCELRIAELTNIEKELRAHSNTVSQLTERIESLRSAEKEWKQTGEKRLAESAKMLKEEAFAKEARQQLAKLDKELKKLGYDPSAHEAARLAEANARGVEGEFNSLQSAQKVSAHLTGEIKALEEEKSKKEKEVRENESAWRSAAEILAKSEAGAPNILEAEDKLRGLREEENSLRGEVGAARQKVEALPRQRARKADFAAQREELNQQIARHKTLERAFGKDGVPALLIEQALPQIEQKANDLLDRLSDGQMSVRFVTQAEYKDKKRSDLKETLDIQISDSAGLRNYEMYSGGEAFRVNFAIRLALSEILAQRKGARLQTLVIDEGFGSQDAFGLQRLMEAINAVRRDFAKILVITHLDELKDAFPHRIEVEKGERGSSVRVI